MYREEVDTAPAPPNYAEEQIDVQPGPNGSMVVNLNPADYEIALLSDHQNLAEGLDEHQLAKIGAKINEWVEADLISRKPWLERRDKGIERCGLTGEPVSQMEGGATVVHPMLVEGAIQFQARWIEEMFPPDGPAKTMLVGQSTDESELRRERCEQHMNWQLTVEDEDYFDESDALGMALPFDGSCFKKHYFDEERRYNTSKFVRADDIIVPYSARNEYDAPRMTHRMSISQNRMSKLVARGYYLDPEITPSLPEDDDNTYRRVDLVEPTYLEEDAEHVIYECHCEFDLEDKGELALPYIITVTKDSQRVLSIRQNWRTNDEEKRKRIWFTHYRYLMGLGYYGFGMFHAIGGLGDAATGVLRGILDSASAANWQGGFTSKDIKLPDKYIKLQHGVWKQTENTAEELKSAFYTPPFKEPSAAMFQVLGLLVEAGHRFLSTTEAMVGEGATNIPVGTTIARIEQGSKVYSGIHKRCHRSLSKELTIRAELNFEYLDARGQQYHYRGRNLAIFKEDYDPGTVDIIPVSDPHIASTPQRIAMAQAVLERAAASPLYDKYEAEKGFLRALKVSNIDALLKKPEDHAPMDPVTEGSMLMMSRGVKAFPDQNHPAHIIVHTGQLQAATKMPPMIGQVVAPLVVAHIQEHIAEQYRITMMQKMGIPLPPLPDKPEDIIPIPPQIDAQISALAAQATQQIAQENAAADPEAQQKQMEAEAHQAAMQKHQQDLQERDLRMQKMQQDMAQAQQPDMQAQVQEMQAQMQQEIDQIKQQADRSLVFAQQNFKNLEAQIRQDTQRQIDQAKREADAKVAQNDNSFTTAQADKETKIKVAEIQAEANDKLVAAKQQSDAQVAALTDQLKQINTTVADLQKQIKETEAKAKEELKRVQDEMATEMKRAEELAKVEEKARKETEKVKATAQKEKETAAKEKQPEPQPPTIIMMPGAESEPTTKNIELVRGADGKLVGAKVSVSIAAPKDTGLKKKKK